MYRNLIFWACSILLVSLILTSTAQADLVAWWRFDDGSGTTAVDSSGNGNDGTVNGGAQWVVGQLGGALQFNGADAEVRAPHIPFDNRSFTVAMWVNPVLYTGEQCIFTQNQSGSTNLSLHFRLGGPGSENVPPGGVRMGFYSNDLDTAGGLIQDNNWYHITFWYDFENQNRRIYINGELRAEASAATSPYLGTSGDTVIGRWDINNQWFQGIIDDVQVYDHALTESEILAVMEGLEGYPYASRPVPADGAMNEYTYASLGWSPGDFAVSHDVYLGDNFDDVNDGTGGTFRGNYTDPFFAAGFTGFPYPDGLVPGMTYYWRIDEVNDLHPDSPWKGNVWSFWVPLKKAYEPNPSDGAKFIDPDVTLTWTAGLGAIMHTVYFGDDFDTVKNATDGTSLVFTSYSPGTLEREKTYYWRVDETDIVTTHKGDVWSFTTARAGGGVKAQYYHHDGGTPHDPPAGAFRTLILTRIDPQINFNWGDPGSPDASINVDDFSAIWTGEVEAAFTETYTFYTNTDDGVILWVDGQEIIRNWTVHATTENSGTIDLVAGQTYSIEMWWFERGGGAVAELRWSSPRTPKQLVPQAALSPPIRASNPNPPNGATGVKMTPALTWNPGDYAASHQVYFGTDEDAVQNATTTSSEYKGTRALGDESYDPGKLAWDTTYYWRIDEVNNLNPDSPWVGSVWSFATGDFLVVDNFEDYDAGENQIWYSWHDGLGYGAIGAPPYYAGNGTGSAVGDETTASYTEENIVNSGAQSMPYWYDNNKPDKAKYSEAQMTLSAPRDWTEEQVKALSLWFRGYPASVGSFTEAPAGTYTMTASGTDITGQSDEFHYAYKMLTGPGTIVAKVESVQNTNAWAKAGVMIRNTLDPNSAHAMAFVTPGQGVVFEYRPAAGQDNVGAAGQQTGVTAPHWVRLERDISGNFTASHSADGSTWEIMGTPQIIAMNQVVYVGLALTAHNAAATCEAVFSNVTITDQVSQQWMNQDIGIQSNDPEPMYVAVANNTGPPAVVYHDNPNAAQIDTWTEWNIDLEDFADQGVSLADVNSIAIGFGNRKNPQAGGSGKMYFDDIRLYRPRYIPGLGTPLAADFDGDGVVYNSDLEIMSDNWLNAPAAPSGSPVGWWKFENNTNDSAGAHHGTANGSPGYTAGIDGQAISLDGVDDYVSVGSIGISGNAPRTIAGWAKADTTNIPNWTTAFGFSNDLTANQADTYFDIQRRNYSSYCIHVYGWERDMMDIDLDWHHLAATYDGTTINWYGDGMLYGSEDRVLDTVDNVMMGKRGDRENYFPGSVDDVRIYSYALSSSEIFYLASGSLADLNDDMKIDFKDYALLVEQWLEQQLWPEW